MLRCWKLLGLERGLASSSKMVTCSCVFRREEARVLSILGDVTRGPDSDGRASGLAAVVRGDFGGMLTGLRGSLNPPRSPK